MHIICNTIFIRLYFHIKKNLTDRIEKFQNGINTYFVTKYTYVHFIVGTLYLHIISYKKIIFFFRQFSTLNRSPSEYSLENKSSTNVSYDMT